MLNASIASQQRCHWRAVIRTGASHTLGTSPHLLVYLPTCAHARLHVSRRETEPHTDRATCSLPGRTRFAGAVPPPGAPPRGHSGPLKTAKQNSASSAVPPAATRARLRGGGLDAAAAAGACRAAGAGRTGLIFWMATCKTRRLAVSTCWKRGTTVVTWPRKTLPREPLMQEQRQFQAIFTSSMGVHACCPQAAN